MLVFLKIAFNCEAIDKLVLRIVRLFVTHRRPPLSVAGLPDVHLPDLAALRRHATSFLWP